MTDSPVNFMMYGHKADYLQSQQLKNKLLKQKLAQILSQLTSQKQQNLKHLKNINNQEETMTQLKSQIEVLEKRKLSQTLHSLNVSKDLTQNHRSTSAVTLDLRYRGTSKSTELPHKKVYLDVNNKSIESSFESQLFDKKLKKDNNKGVKRMTSYGNLYNKKSFSLNKPSFR